MLIILASQKFPPFYGTLKLLTDFTKARHLYIHDAKLIQYRMPLQEFYMSLAGVNTIISQDLVTLERLHHKLILSLLPL